MKKMLLTLVCAAAALGVCAAPQQEVAFDKLPKLSREFIEKNFPMGNVKSVEIDRKSTWDHYTVQLDNGSTITFEGDKGMWTRITMTVGTVPATAIPEKIQSFVAKKYPDQTIVQLARTPTGYKADLNSGQMLSFDKSGKFEKGKHTH